MLPNFRSIETSEQLLQWAQAVNSGLTDKEIPDAQDIYAHSNRDNIDKFSLESGQDRKLVVCSVRNVMDFAEVERLLSVLARAKATKQMELEYAELDMREALLTSRERAFRESMKPFHKRMAELRERNEFLERAYGQLQAQENCAVENMRAAKREANEFRGKAEKYDAIRSLLA